MKAKTFHIEYQGFSLKNPVLDSLLELFEVTGVLFLFNLLHFFTYPSSILYTNNTFSLEKTKQFLVFNLIQVISGLLFSLLSHSPLPLVITYSVTLSVALILLVIHRSDTQTQERNNQNGK